MQVHVVYYTVFIRLLPISFNALFPKGSIAQNKCCSPEQEASKMFICSWQCQCAKEPNAINPTAILGMRLVHSAHALPACNLFPALHVAGHHTVLGWVYSKLT